MIAERHEASNSTADGNDNMVDGVVVHTCSPEETYQYLKTVIDDIDKDFNPRIIQRPASPVTYEQQIFVRFLRPPTPPPPGIIIIKEIPPTQPSLPPLILRERPPAFSKQPYDIIIERRIPYGTHHYVQSPLIRNSTYTFVKYKSISRCELFDSEDRLDETTI